MHVRKTDKGADCPSSEASSDAIDGVLARWPEAGLFLATDDPGHVASLVKRYGQRIVTYPVRSLRRDVPEGIIDAVVTLYLLRQTGGVVGSRVSGFSMCAGWDCGFLDVPLEGRTLQPPLVREGGIQISAV